MVAQRPSSARTRRWGAGTAAVARLLVAVGDPLTGVAIADAVGVTQPRVSQILRQLGERRAIDSTPEGYVARRARLLDLYVQRAQPLLVESEGYWYSTRPMIAQAMRVVDIAAGAGMTVAFSADLGPDLLVPWRHPTVAIVYADHRMQLDDDGFVHAEGRVDASLIVRWTKDATLLSPFGSWPVEHDGIPLTDPVQQWSDLLDLGGNDRQEAADRLRQAVISRSIEEAR
jgi:hypothetical protein